MKLKMNITKITDYEIEVDLEEWNDYSNLSAKEKHNYINSLIEGPKCIIDACHDTDIKDTNTRWTVEDWDLEEEEE